MTLYVAVTADEYELPVFVTDSCIELARFLNMPVHKVYNCFSRQKYKGVKNQRVARSHRIYRVIVGEDEE